jgi:cardiolipin synthase
MTRRSQHSRKHSKPRVAPARRGGHAQDATGDDDGSALRVFQAGRVAFAEILRRIEQAERRIEVRAFLWRDDRAGNRLGQALLAAADRGVAVRIHKDRIAAVYEYTGGNKQSFFHKRPSTMHRFQAWFLGAVYRAPGSSRQRPSALAEALLRHPNVYVSHERNRFDHSKLFVFDERIVTLGSMNIGDNHHSDWVDVMVELEGAEHVERLRARLDGARFDPTRAIDFLVHSRAREPRGSCPMLLERLALIEAAERSLTVEMAYLGDGRFTAALLRAVRRGVQVKLVTSAMADVLGDLNRATCDTLLARTGAPANLTIVLLPRMVHSKIVVADGHVCDVGSANFTPLSHGVYDEINLYAVNRRFGRALEDAVERHCADGEVVQERIGYRRLHSQIERVIVAYQARRGGRLRATLRRPALPAIATVTGGSTVTAGSTAAAASGVATSGTATSAAAVPGAAPAPGRAGRRLRFLPRRR